MRNVFLKYSGFVGIVIGLSVATIVHGLIEVPILIWANRGGVWNSFLWFSTYSQFAEFDKIMAVSQWAIGIILGYVLGRKYITKLLNKQN